MISDSGQVACVDPAVALAFLHGKASNRKLRLFACACCRLVWSLLPPKPSRARVEAVERQADGGTTVPAPRAADRPAPRPGDSPAVHAEIASIFAGCNDAFAAALVASAMAERADPQLAGRRAQAALLADMFGRPALRFNPRWRSLEIAALTQAAYDRRHFENLPRLADLLQAAGCTDRLLLEHCRSRGEHVRGCWALDLILGKS